MTYDHSSTGVVQVDANFRLLSRRERTSSDSSGETAHLSRLIRAFGCNLCIGYQYIHALVHSRIICIYVDKSQ